MYQIQPYIVVPNLIEQPTWGGDYIRTLKNIDADLIDHKKIGQSYELFRNSHLSRHIHTKKSPSLDLSDPENPQDPLRLYANDDPFAISSLIIQDPEAVLGKKAIDTHGISIEIMIKLNQAKGNSYQVHARKAAKDNNWLPKPESWYFFEPGLVTLCLNPETDWKDYKHVCQLIAEEADLISKSIVQGDTTLEKGRIRLKTLIQKHNPVKYVNLIQVAKDAAIDLSKCGIHHSWEENDQTHPQGNIVYEVQKNVYDPDCTIRSFDKGKIKNDGTVRELHIDDYFDNLDKTTEANIPKNYYTKGKVINKTSSYTLKQILQTSEYQLEEISLNRTISNQHTTTTDSYQHLFVRKGTLRFEWQDKSWEITQGYSLFVPASIGRYRLVPVKGQHAKVLRTSV